MKFFYQEHSLKSGIYKIINIHTNRIYVGQAKEFKERWSQHKKALLNPNRKTNRFLLNDFNKCRTELGHDDFIEFHVLELMENSTKQERNAREEYWISLYWDKQDTCYNFKQKTEAKERFCYSLTPEETSKKISEATKKALSTPEAKKRKSEITKKQWLGLSEEQKQERHSKVWAKEETRKNYGQKIKGMWSNPETRPVLVETRKRSDLVALFKKNCHTPEAIAKMATARTKNHGRVVSPAGEVYEVIGLKAFCLEHGIPLSQLSNFHKMVSHKPNYKSVCGWKTYLSSIQHEKDHNFQQQAN